MTKEQFRALAMYAVEQVMSMPEDLGVFRDVFPLMRLTTKDGETVVVGIEERKAGDE